MTPSWRSRAPGIARSSLLVLVALGLATAVVSLLEDVIGVSNASAVYLVAVDRPASRSLPELDGVRRRWREPGSRPVSLRYVVRANACARLSG
jgi:hypothetical protein